MADLIETTRCVLPFFQVLQFTDKNDAASLRVSRPTPVNPAFHVPDQLTSGKRLVPQN